MYTCVYFFKEFVKRIFNNWAEHVMYNAFEDFTTTYGLVIL